MGSQTAIFNFSIAGKTIVGNLVTDASGEIAHVVTIGAAEAGELTTRTSATAGVIEVTAAASAITGAKADIFWTGGLRYNVDVDDVTEDDVTFSGGSGDDLPDAETDVTICEPVVLDTDFDGSKVQIIAAQNSLRGHLLFKDSNGDNAFAAELLAASPKFYVVDTLADNPIDGDGIDELRVSNASGTAASAFTIGIGYDSDT